MNDKCLSETSTRPAVLKLHYKKFAPGGNVTTFSVNSRWEQRLSLASKPHERKMMVFNH